MVELFNNYIKVSNDANLIFNFMHYLTFEDRKGKQFRAYEMDGSNNLLIPRGFLNYLPSGLDIVDRSISDIDPIEYNEEFVKNCLTGITLREDQLLAIKKMSLARRGIIQMGTGGGKTECICGFMQVLREHLGCYPDTLILAPTTHLVNATIKRLAKYGIPATKYSKRRGKVEGIVVTHPASVNNDLSKDNSILSNVKVFICDEGHHLKADTWRRLSKYMDSVEFSLAVSATAIYPEHLPVVELSRLEPDELLVLGATGGVLLNVPPSYYISKGILANPVMFRVDHASGEILKDPDNWLEVRKKSMESHSRSLKIAEIVAFFNGLQFKSLVLVNTKEHALLILEILSSLGLSDDCRASFGGSQFYRWDPDTNSEVSVYKKDEDTMQLFEEGKFRILVATSHLYEGYDVPNLDVVVLAGVGKQLRRVIQGIGRALRRTKSGVFAYIVDFTDSESKVLRKHSISRVTMCRNIIGIPEHQIYTPVTFQYLKQKVCELEGLL